MEAAEAQLRDKAIRPRQAADWNMAKKTDKGRNEDFDQPLAQFTLT